MDDNFDKCVSYSEFRKALNDYKMGLTDEETQALFSYMDLNGNGIVEIDELVRVLQGEMNEFRTNLVSQAFKKLDKPVMEHSLLMTLKVSTMLRTTLM